MRKFGWMTVLVMVMGCAAVAFAAEQAAPAAAPAAQAAPAKPADFSGMLKGAGVGAIAGLTLALLGFAKDKASDKKFVLKDAMPTILMGLVLGFFSGWNGLDLTKWTEWKDAASTVLIGELLLKAGWRNGAPAVGGAIQSLFTKKEGTAS